MCQGTQFHSVVFVPAGNPHTIHVADLSGGVTDRDDAGHHDGDPGTKNGLPPMPLGLLSSNRGGHARSTSKSGAQLSGRKHSQAPARRSSDASASGWGIDDEEGD